MITVIQTCTSTRSLLYEILVLYSLLGQCCDTQRCARADFPLT